MAICYILCKLFIYIYIYYSSVFLNCTLTHIFFAHLESIVPHFYIKIYYKIIAISLLRYVFIVSLAIIIINTIVTILFRLSSLTENFSTFIAIGIHPTITINTIKRYSKFAFISI